MNNKSDEIKAIILEVYEGKIDGSDLDYFAYMLNRSVFEGEGPLEDIYEIAYSCELEAGIDNKDSGAWWLFDLVINLMDDGESTAKRLYDCFMHCYDDFALFYKLIAYNEEYLTKEQSDAAKNKASKLFDKQLLRGLI